MILYVILIFGCFALLHSLLAADRIKDLFTRLAGRKFVKVFYRFGYVVISAIASLAAFGLISVLPDKVLWNPSTPMKIIMGLLQFSGLLLGLATFSRIDSMGFIGFKQAMNFIKGREVSGDAEGIEHHLSKDGLYGIMRHPLYTAGILIFSFIPVITANWLTVSILADLYFIYGALIEERRLIKRFGQEYRDYMKTVPRFFPRLPHTGQIRNE
ncbi:MAG: isoprenylcysteine carboxylmethyltransferase family protein [Nitrospiraceae bacterium]|nr:isoprenylcysteine carboxylmethyltransferase family protein [Nitrospiraceae bacterium]